MEIEKVKSEDIKVIDFNNEEESNWLVERQKYITASECLFAVQNFSSDETMRMFARQIDKFIVSKEVFYKKKHLSGEMLKIYNDLKKNTAKTAGHKFEERVANIGKDLIIKKKNNEKIEEEKIELIANGKKFYTIKKAGIGATPDYYLKYNENDINLIECKTTTLDIDNEETFKRVQQRYLMQCQCQMLCTGIKTCWLVVSKLDKDRTEILTTKIHEIVENKELQQEILDCVERCLQWMQDVENGVVELERNEGEDEEILNNLYNQNLSDYLNKYGEVMIFEKEKEKHYENVKNIIKSIAYNNIKVEGWNVDFKVQNATYETIESLEEKIKKNEKEREELKDKLKKIKENGDLKFLKSRAIIKNIQISKVGGSLN